MPLKYIQKPIKGHFFLKWLEPIYYDAAHQLECHSSERIWSLNDIVDRMLKDNEYGGFVVTDLKEPVGYVIYRRDRRRKRILVLSMVIHPDYRRMGLGALLLDKVKLKLTMPDERYRYVAWVVRESNLSGHLFLKSQGFQVVEIVKNHFVDHYPDLTEREDGYAFVYKESS